MTERCSKNITPDSLTGMIFAMEGMRNVVVLLNGPMGCKFYHSTTSQFLSLRPPLYLPLSEEGEKVPVDYNFLNDWFFRQSRVPCTYLDGYDYVYGTGEKVREALHYIKEHVEFELLVIVNSPGASLIGDNLYELAKETLGDSPCVVLESPGYSGDYCEGYENAVLELLRQVGIPGWKKTTSRTCREKAVNLLGLSIWQRYWEGDLLELKRILELCGIKVNCALCVGSSLEDVAALPDADLNVVLYPEMGLRTAEFLKEACGTPYVVCQGPPIGFEAVTNMVQEICQILGTDETQFILDCEKARALAWFKINSVHQMCGLPEGAAFAIEGSASEIYAYSRFFMDYLGMVPECLSVTSGRNSSFMEKLSELLKRHQAGHPEEKDILDTQAELVFGNANTIAALKTRNQVFCGIEISLPGMGYIDVLPKTQMGVQGSLFLVEQVLNGLMSKL